MKLFGKKNDGMKRIKPDRATVKYSKLSDDEAYDKVKQLKKDKKDLLQMEQLASDPRRLMKLRELLHNIAWHKQNKNRSKYFKWEVVPASMRRALRSTAGGKVETLTKTKPVDAGFLSRKRNKRLNKDDMRRIRKEQKRQKSQGLRITESNFSRQYKAKQAEKAIAQATAV